MTKGADVVPHLHQNFFLTLGTNSARNSQDAAPFFTAKSRGRGEVRLGVIGGVVFRVPMGCLERSPSGAASPYLVLVGHRRRGSVFRGQFCCAAMYWAKNPFADAAPDGDVEGAC